MTFSFLKGNNHSSHNSILPTKKTVKILGILLDDDLRWNSHVDYLTKKGASLLHSFSHLKIFGTQTEVLKSVYCSYVRPSLEYACPAWHPGLTKDQTDRLETIQKKAVKIILGQNYSTYEDALKQLNLDSLDSRRHGLTYRFGLNCLNSPTHCRLLPNFVSPPTEGPVTRLQQIKNNCPQLLTCSAYSTERYRKSFVPYFTSHFNNIDATNI